MHHVDGVALISLRPNPGVEYSLLLYRPHTEEWDTTQVYTPPRVDDNPQGTFEHRKLSKLVRLKRKLCFT